MYNMYAALGYMHAMISLVGSLPLLTVFCDFTVLDLNRLLIYISVHLFLGPIPFGLHSRLPWYTPYPGITTPHGSRHISLSVEPPFLRLSTTYLTVPLGLGLFGTSSQ